MNDILTFCDNHWFLAFLIIYLGYALLVLILRTPLRLICVIFRGWPPAHLDADGDFKPEKE